ncbi:ADAM 17-like protease [Penaeus vannamei]|uniref:ADAM17 protein n=1 Tax=Penaeus vannamei TaxID=6689 RepID=A0A3R7PZN4_PENVA|nr:ADAM 17-like protease [Penaeus vannamei]ROT82229.1 ADAM17 protein [Penaeus vannamei]
MESFRLVTFVLFVFSESVFSFDITGGFFGRQPKHPNLRYYEVIDSSAFNHHVVKRGIKESNHRFNKIKEVQFSALGRDFRLILNPRKGLLHSQFKAYAIDGAGNEKIIHVDHENFYEGRVFGEKMSEVSAHLEDGVMTATIHTPDDTYHVEPSWRHIPDAKDDSMIVYRGSDVKYSWEDNHPTLKGHKMCDYVKEGNETTEMDDEEEWIEGYEPPIGSIPEPLPDEHGPKRRVKRQQAEPYNFNGDKTRCPLLLVADYRFFREMGGSNYKTTVNYLINLIDRVDKIYENTVWKDGVDTADFSGMGFVIKKILVHQEWSPVGSNQVHYNMERSSWDVRNLLEVFSREYSHKDYCLAHLFTDIKFEGGILGLAYVGSPRRNSVGGICTPEYFKNGHTLYLNSGLSSSRNHYGQRVITREADLVTAHEFGHNWGSEHDPDRPECSPSASQGGSYLMYTYSVSGYDINNKRFSPCSLRAIRAVLVAKSSRCFTEPEESYCGNQRVEGQEQCDAGLVGQDDVDLCCDKHCKLRDGATCSDRNSPCCHGCQYMSQGVKCREQQPATCENESRCLGTTAVCPKAKPMDDGTPCIEKGQCHQGSCLPYCETQEMQSCMCDTIDDACKRCCRKTLNDTCFPVVPLDILPDGTPCIHGFCNKGKCEKTVQDVVERFWDIIEDININTVLMFLRDNIVGTVIIISVIIWVPASCIFSYVDRRRQEDYCKYVRWYYSNELIHPTDSVRIIDSKRTRIHEPGRVQEATNRVLESAGRPHDPGTRAHDTRDPPEGAESRQNLNTPQCPPVSQHYTSAM